MKYNAKPSKGMQTPSKGYHPVLSKKASEAIPLFFCGKHIEDARRPRKEIKQKGYSVFHINILCGKQRGNAYVDVEKSFQ